MGPRTASILFLLAGPAVALPVAAECPGPARLAAIVEHLDLAATSRAARFGIETPHALYQKAAAKSGSPQAERDGQKMFGVMLAPLPVEALWMVINDDEQHPRGLPIRYSEVLEGEPRGDNRVVFQYFRQWGVGRWWVSEIAMNAKLFTESKGGLWEIYWEDRIDNADTTEPPYSEVPSGVHPVEDTRGAWLLIPLGEQCTLIEYFIWSNPGGMAAKVQKLFAAKGVRDAMNGVIGMAEEYAVTPYPGPPFRRPDGSLLD